MKSDAIFKKIEARLASIDPNDRKVVYVFKFQITDESGAVVKTVCELFEYLNVFLSILT